MNYRCCSKISKGVNSGRIIRIYCRILDNICINQNRRTRKVNYCVQCTPRQVYPFSRLWLSFLVEVWLKFFSRQSFQPGFALLLALAPSAPKKESSPVQCAFALEALLQEPPTSRPSGSPRLLAQPAVQLRNFRHRSSASPCL